MKIITIICDNNGQYQDLKELFQEIEAEGITVSSMIHHTLMNIAIADEIADYIDLEKDLKARGNKMFNPSPLIEIEEVKDDEDVQ